MNTENTHIAAQACLTFLCQINAKEANIIAPYLNRLFFALDNGDTFIQLHNEEKATLNALNTFLHQKNAPLVLTGNRLALALQHHLEKQIAQKIHALCNTLDNTLPEKDTQNLLNTWFSDEKSRDQKSAVALALFNQFMLISGGPGTGKTTTVARLLALLCEQKETLPEIQLIAPTGKAAMRMTQAIQNSIAQHLNGISERTKQHLRQLRAQTIHRLLALKPPQMRPLFHPEHPLTADIVLLDEASMIDNHLFHQLLFALPTHCRLILLGDTNQLPAVGIGAILQSLNQSPFLSEKTELAHKAQSLLQTNTLPETLKQNHAHLTISHRFNEKSGIGQLAKAVLNGETQQAWDCFQRFSSDLEQHSNNIDNIAKQLYQAQHNYWQIISQNTQDNNTLIDAFNALTECIVLTATHEDSEAFNLAYCRLLAQKKHLQAKQTYFTGQIIIIQENDYRQALYNGDIGIITQEAQRHVAHFLDYSGSLKTIAVSLLPKHDNAFAITVHKSQGSEYQNVYFISPKEASLMNRALLYTAITRAKERFIYFGEENLFQAACQNNNTRKTALADFLFQAA